MFPFGPPRRIIPLAGRGEPPAPSEDDEEPLSSDAASVATQEGGGPIDLRAVVVREVRDALAPTAAKSADTNGNGGGASPTQMAPAQLPPVVAPKPAEPKLAVDYESNDSINLTGHRIGEVLVGWKAATDGQ